MDNTRFLVDWGTISKTELYQQITGWVNEQIALFRARCSSGDNETEWRKNQGRVDAYVQVLNRLLHPEKIFIDKEKKVETTTT